MIIWLASYPKSGNTWIRSMLSAYLFSPKGQFEFNLLKNISQFSINVKKLEKQVYKNSQEKIYKNWIPSQKEINQDGKFHILKTHNALCNINGYNFTNKDNTTGAIYIVRDPRNLILSISHHYSLSMEEAYGFLTNKRKIIFPSQSDKEKKNINEKEDFNFLGDWATHYQSWKNIKFAPILIIKYEDIIINEHKVFLSILNFLSKFIKITLDTEKIENVLTTTTFNNLSKMEDQDGFDEAIISETTKKKVKFFNLGKKNDWKNLLHPKMEKKITTTFHKDMKDLGYI